MSRKFFAFALVEILRDRWAWRRRIFLLAIFEIRTAARGTALSWGWFFLRPLAYILCPWFAIGLGLRSGLGGEEGVSYLLWLAAGMIPWLFMRDTLSGGADTFHRKFAIVTTMKMPLDCITSIHSVSSMLAQLLFFAVLTVLCLSCGMAWDAYLLQLPVLLLLMLLFWDMVALMLAIVGTVYRDFAQMASIISMPLFWVSGVIFNVDRFPIEWLKPLFALNPVTFFVSGFRDVFCYKTWVFADTDAAVGFAVVFVLTLAATSWLLQKFGRVVPDLV